MSEGHKYQTMYFHWPPHQPSTMSLPPLYLKSAQIGLEFPCQDLECSGLPNAIGAYQPQNLSRTRDRQAVQLEGVGRVTVCGVLLEVARQVDDGDGSKWALLRVGMEVSRDMVYNFTNQPHPP